MAYKTIYVSVKIELESENEIDDEVIEDFLTECDYNFSSRSDGVKVFDTELCGRTEK